jgi:hypothetical protein
MTEPDDSNPPADRAIAAPPHLLSPDERLRLVMADQLALQLMRVNRLLDRCESSAAEKTADPMGAFDTAARLIRANSHIAGTLACVVQVESRHRSVVETIQKPDPKMLELEAQRNKKTPAQMRKEIAAKMVPILEERRKQEAAQLAEDYRAAVETFDAPLHAPY